MAEGSDSTADLAGILSSFLLFGNLLHGCLFLAFLSLQGQIVGLVGPKGLSPAIDRLRFLSQAPTSADDAARDDKAPEAKRAGRLRRGRRLLKTFATCPSLCILFRNGCSAASLRLQCRAGLVVSALGAVGVLPHFLSASLCALLYLSLATVGGDFMALQWDSLVVEATSLYAVSSALLDLLPFSPIALGLARFSILHLLFRLMLSSGVCKIASRCPKWADLSAMQFHYWTQPLPHIGGWLAYNMLPRALHRFSTFATLAIELVLPLLMLVPARATMAAATLGFVGHMLAIMATGSFGFFNILTITLCSINAHYFGLGWWWTVPHQDRVSESAFSLPVQALRLGAMAALSGLLYLYNAVAIYPLVKALRIESLDSWVDGLILNLKERIVNPNQDPAVTVDTIRAALHQANERVRDRGVRIIILDDEASAHYGTTFAFKGLHDSSILPDLTLDDRSYTASELLAEERERVLQRKGNPTSLGDQSGLIKYTQCALRTPLLTAYLALLTAVNKVFVNSRVRRWAWDTLFRAFACQAPFHLVNSYGLFARMTTHRYEIVIERSTDGSEWAGVSFRYKPGRVWEARERLPSPTVYHMPRLDWRLWFLPLDPSSVTSCLAGLGDAIRPPPWFRNLLRGILEDNKDIVGLLRDFKPWPRSEPRRFVRATLWQYTFSERTADGKWPQTFWDRKLVGDYSLPLVYDVPDASRGAKEAETGVDPSMGDVGVGKRRVEVEAS